jgi:hypothetical protein
MKSDDSLGLCTPLQLPITTKPLDCDLKADGLGCIVTTPSFSCTSRPFVVEEAFIWESHAS